MSIRWWRVIAVVCSLQTLICSASMEVEVMDPFGCGITEVDVMRLKEAAIEAFGKMTKVDSSYLSWSGSCNNDFQQSFNRYVAEAGLGRYVSAATSSLVGLLSGDNIDNVIKDRVRFVVFCKDSIRDVIHKEGSLTYIIENERDRGNVVIRLELDDEDQVSVDYKWTMEDNGLTQQMLLSKYLAMRAKMAYAFIPIVVDHGETIENAIREGLLVTEAWAFKMSELADDRVGYAAEIRLQSLISALDSIVNSAQKEHPNFRVPEVIGAVLALDFLERYDPGTNYWQAYASLSRKTLEDLEKNGAKPGYVTFLRRYLIVQELSETDALFENPAKWIREKLSNGTMPEQSFLPDFVWARAR